VIKVKAVSSYIHVRKPDKKIFEYALRQAGVKGGEAAYVDDRPDRVQGAHELGINVVVFDGDVKRLKDKINNL
jgi:putative hydrolase of the HAD superfamily